jgi:hypothetical protein
MLGRRVLQQTPETILFAQILTQVANSNVIAITVLKSKERGRW